MRQLPAFARTTRWVGPSHEGIVGDLASATQFITRSSFGETPKRPMANRIIERGLRVRILTGFTLVIALTLLIAGWSYYHISTLGKAAEHLFLANYRSIGYMHQMELSLLGVESASDATAANTVQQSADENFRKLLALEYANIAEPGELAATKTIERDFNTLLRVREGRSASEIHAASQRDQQDCETVLRMNEHAMLSRAEAVKAQAHFARISSLGITVLLVGISIFLAVAVSRRSLAEFQELDRAKSNFVATAAHELKNPLSSIKTTSGILAEGIVGPLTEKQSDLVSNIRRESNRLLNLVRELLDLAKLETGTLQLQRTTVDVETLIESATLPISLRAEQAGVTIDTAVMRNVPDVNVDPNKMAWAITNLLANAVRYSPRGGSVAVNASVNEDQVWISVTDTGKGIAEHNLSRIFDKFVQVEEGAMGMGSGTGLGLSIAREITLAHGGRIWATSTMGQGSTFTIALPLNAKV